MAHHAGRVRLRTRRSRTTSRSVTTPSTVSPSREMTSAPTPRRRSSSTTSATLLPGTGVFAVALARGVEVGLDVERLRDVPDPDLGAVPLFTARDRARLGALPRAARGEAFLRLFTVREALAKRDGAGITGGGGGHRSFHNHIDDSNGQDVDNDHHTPPFTIRETVESGM